jgi:hypothetical protein
MEIGIALSAFAFFGAAGLLLRKQIRILQVEWRVRRGLRGALSQAV